MKLLYNSIKSTNRSIYFLFIVRNSFESKRESYFCEEGKL